MLMFPFHVDNSCEIPRVGASTTLQLHWHWLLLYFLSKQTYIKPRRFLHVVGLYMCK